MNIMTNLSALNAARQQGIHSSNFGKSTEKLSSGFKINRAADGAAELGISEQMRAQIRGLNRSVTNADEGQNFIQTGDGAMNEIHDMLQRMRELSVQSINDTNTEADRAALAKEFDALQSEIDRVNTGTYFNTQPVFQEHEDSFYQIAGNRKWKSDQLHTITAPKNDLIINLPEGYDYDPKQYSLTVPNGTYTTQELLDEIEDAFAAMTPAPKEQPGLNLEFDQYGYCNLNFEDAQGNVTKIQSVDGTLAYLIYDCHTGSPRPDITGTSVIGGSNSSIGSNAGILIEKGKNDTLSFYLENGDQPVDLTISTTNDPKQFTLSRQELIDRINAQLRDNQYTRELYAKLDPDGKHSLRADHLNTDNPNLPDRIQLIGSGLAGVTGLKGNMFVIDNKALGEPPRTGGFYDNIAVGSSAKRPASLEGGAVSPDKVSNVNPIEIIAGHNDTLRLMFDSPTNAFPIEIPLLPSTNPPTTKEEYTDMGDIVKTINTYLQDPSNTPPGITGTMADYLFARKDESDGHLIIEAREPEQDGKIYGITQEPLATQKKNDILSATYNTLFGTTIHTYSKDPIVDPGSDPSSPATLTGWPIFNTSTDPSDPTSESFEVKNDVDIHGNSINQADRTIEIKIGGTNNPSSINIEIPARTYANLEDLRDTLNNILANDPRSTPFQFKVVDNGGNKQLQIESTDNTLASKLTLDTSTYGQNTVYNQFFYGSAPISNEPSFSLVGKEFYVEGNTTKTEIDMDNTTIIYVVRTWFQDEDGNAQALTINSSNNTLGFQVKTESGGQTQIKTVNITIPSGSYTDPSDLIEKINKQMQTNKDLPLKASYDSANGYLKLETLQTNRTSTTTIDPVVNGNLSSAWYLFAGKDTTYKSPLSVPFSDATPKSITGVNNFKKYGYYDKNKPVEIVDDGSAKDNHTFTITFKDKSPDVTIEIPGGSYSMSDIKVIINQQIEDQGAKDKVYANTNDGYLIIATTVPGEDSFSIVETDGKFYTEILGEKYATETEFTTSTTGVNNFKNKPYIIGRAPVNTPGKMIEIIKDVNDTFTVDLSYTPNSDSLLTDFPNPLKLTATIPEGNHTIQYIQEKINEQFNDILHQPGGYYDQWMKKIKENYEDYVKNDLNDGYLNTLNPNDPDYLDFLDFNLDVKVEAGYKYNAGVAEVDEGQVLSVRLDATGNFPGGSYTLDGVRGSAAYSIFYATTEKQEFSYAVGSKDISDGVTFEPGKNTFAFNMDGKDYEFTFPEIYYTADQFIAELNNQFEKTVNLKASLENGCLKILYKGFGDHKITNIHGDAKGLVFYKEDERDDLDPFMLQVGALGHQGLELNRFRVNTMSLGINTVTVSRVKYAEKALDRLDKAIDQLSTRRSTYGALQNRIDFLKSNNKNAAQNVQASESRIRDANMAKEMIDYVKNQITTQASESVLAQANQLPNRIANLLF